MAERKYDLVVFGASGFTGQFVVEEVARVAEEEKLKWAIAGRSMQKLQKVLSESSTYSGKNLEEIPIIIADTTSPNTLDEMAKQTKLVLNAAGPYRHYGEPVVKACIENGTHHLDISGEPQYLEKMQLLYNGKAKENNAIVIGSVGFDSIPAETGLEYTAQQFKDGEMTNVESFIAFQSGPEGSAVNTGTLESAVYGVAHWSELKALRKSLYPEPMPKYEPRLPKRRMLFYNKELGQWCLPFLGSDKSVVYRSVRDLLATSRLDKPYPHIFTLGTFKKGGPTRKQIEGTSFSMTFIGQGFDKVEKERAGKQPNKKVMTKITAPEPGYTSTSIFMVQAAMTVLRDQDKMYHKAGVLPPGAAFWNTNLIQRLEKRGIKYTIVSDSSTDKTE